MSFCTFSLKICAVLLKKPILIFTKPQVHSWSVWIHKMPLDHVTSRIRVWYLSTFKYYIFILTNRYCAFCTQKVEKIGLKNNNTPKHPNKT